MANCNNNTHPLQRGGTSQQHRLLPAQSPGSAPLMDKGPMDWMVWGSRLSTKLQYYNHQLLAAGNLEPFFAADVAARLAMLATHPLPVIPAFTREQLLVLTLSSNTSKIVVLRRTFTSLFDVVVGYMQKVDATHLHLQRIEQQQPGLLAGIDFSFQLHNHIQTRLAPMLSRILAYYKAATASGLTDNTAPGIIDIFNEPISTAALVINEGLSISWWNGHSSWADYESSITPEPSIFGIGATVAAKIQHAARHNFFAGLLDDTSGSAALLVALSGKAVAKLTAQWPYHAPHYTLYLTWLQLLEHARHSMNGLTARHLECYYEKVLQLKRRSPKADSAYLVLELHKSVSQTALQKNVLFAGGKDGSGAEIFYASTRETVLNKAKIASLQSMYLADEKDIMGGVSQTDLLFASPVANSSDGLGKPLTQPLGEWHPFVNKTFGNGSLLSIDMPLASVGFAVSSHYLRLKEGKRKIVLKLNTSQNTALAGKQVLVFITTEKEWLAIGTVAFSAVKMNDGATDGVAISFTIGADSPAITGYSSKIHGHRFSGSEPILKVLLPNNGSTNALTLPAVAQTALLRADLEVQVGEITGAYNNEGLKNLLLQNDTGVLNAAKPFQPFGNEPTPGNALIVGSEELFYKPNAQLQLNVQWKDLPASTGDLDFDYDEEADYQSVPSTNGPYYPEIDFQTLEAGNWVTRGAKLNLFPASAGKLLPNAVYQSPSLPSKLFLQPYNSYSAYSAGATAGFVRLQLRHDFGHRNYRHAHTWYLMEKGKNNPNVSEPTSPYQPVLQSLSLSYKAACSSSPGEQNPPLQWWQLAPFGEAQALTNGATLLPSLIQFDGDVQAQGSLLIGLENVAGGQTVSLLFQLLEGSENPLQAKPEQHLNWQYLAGNQWSDFPGDAIDDGTAQFIQSGIVHLVLPADASTEHTLLQPQLLWLKATVAKAPDAICKIIGIHTNAIEAIRVLPEHKEMERLVAEKGTINKMNQPNGLVKKVDQPYASFGGRASEAGEPFYVRISERLKHKDRAINIWDYERLVLEHFPEIYKVKCLNHTKLSGSVADGNLQYNEVAPGYVTIITIPNLWQRNDADPLKPYTKASTLDGIQQFLKSRASCHVQIATAQPQFEEVRLAATVVLADGYDDAPYYRLLLQQELTAFLSPWAFGQNTELDFGGSLHKSVLIDFLEELPFVDYLTDVQLFHKAGETAVESGDVEEVMASTARSILVSAATNKHLFTVLTPHSLPANKVKCKDV